MRILFPFLIVSLLIAGGCQRSEQPGVANGSDVSLGPASSPPASNHSGKLAPGDLLNVVLCGVLGANSATAEPVRIDAKGMVCLFDLGQVKIGGMSAGEAERAIYGAYRADNDESMSGVCIRRLQTASPDRPLPGTIANFDLVRVVMWNLQAPGQETIRISRIRPDGTFSVPFLGVQKLAGLTTAQAQEALRAAYKDAKLVERLAVSVLVLEPAPPDAAKLDLPDEPLNPVPFELLWLYEDGITDFRSSDVSALSKDEPRAVTAQSISNHPGRFAPGDLLTIACADLIAPGVDCAKPVRIDANGAVSLYYIPPVKIGGLTPTEAENAIIEAYRAGNFLSAIRVDSIRRLQAAATDHPLIGAIGNFDLIRVTMTDLYAPGEATIRIERVDSDGTLRLPYLGATKLAGLTADQAEQAVAADYRKANLVQNTAVSVLVLEAAPPEAAKMDLPDEPLNPVPPALQWLYDDRPTDAPPIVTSNTRPSGAKR